MGRLRFFKGIRGRCFNRRQCRQCNKSSLLHFVHMRDCLIPLLYSIDAVECLTSECRPVPWSVPLERAASRGHIRFEDCRHCPRFMVSICSTGSTREYTCCMCILRSSWYHPGIEPVEYHLRIEIAPLQALGIQSADECHDATASDPTRPFTSCSLCCEETDIC